MSPSVLLLVKCILNMEPRGFSLTPSFTDNVFYGLYFCILLIILGGLGGENADSELSVFIFPLKPEIHSICIGKMFSWKKTEENDFIMKLQALGSFLKMFETNETGRTFIKTLSIHYSSIVNFASSFECLLPGKHCSRHLVYISYRNKDPCPQEVHILEFLVHVRYYTKDI